MKADQHRRHHSNYSHLKMRDGDITAGNATYCSSRTPRIINFNVIYSRKNVDAYFITLPIYAFDAICSDGRLTICTIAFYSANSRRAMPLIARV